MFVAPSLLTLSVDKLDLMSLLSLQPLTLYRALLCLYDSLEAR